MLQFQTCQITIIRQLRTSGQIRPSTSCISLAYVHLVDQFIGSAALYLSEPKFLTRCCPGRERSSYHTPSFAPLPQMLRYVSVRTTSCKVWFCMSTVSKPESWPTSHYATKAYKSQLNHHPTRRTAWTREWDPNQSDV